MHQVYSACLRSAGFMVFCLNALRKLTLGLVTMLKTTACRTKMLICVMASALLT